MKILKIAEVKQIIDKLIEDGDLRKDSDLEYFDHEYGEGDDLGFYQQACEFLIKIIERVERIKE